MRRLYIILMTLCNGTISLSQSGLIDPTYYTGTGANNTITTTRMQSDGKLLIAGYFSQYNGSSANGLARIDTNGTLDGSFNIGSGPNNDVYTIDVQNDGKILIGGKFVAFNGTSRIRMARLNSNGTLDPTFTVGNGFDNSVYDISIQNDGKIIVVGTFNNYNGSAVNNIIRLNTNGTKDNSFNIGSGASYPINCVEVQNDGKILIGGAFDYYNGVLVHGLARLNTDGTLDAGFNTGTGVFGSVNTITILADGRLMIGGNFSSINNQTLNNLARLHNDGTVDPSFNPGSGPNNYVTSILPCNNSKTIIGGAFLNYNLLPRGQIAKIDSNGTLDQTFLYNTSGLYMGPSNYVTSLEMQADKKIIVAGAFTEFDFITHNRLVRLIDTNYTTGFLNNDSPDFILFPNPNQGRFTVIFQHDAQKCLLEIINALGQTVYSDIYYQDSFSTPKLTLPVGHYIVRIISERSVINKQMIVHESSDQ